jgi:hypothetical protein
MTMNYKQKMAMVGAETKYITLFLNEANYLKSPAIFLCECKTPVFKHNYEVTDKENGKPLNKNVVEIQCRNWRCGKVYCLDFERDK